MGEAEFDRYAEEYNALHAASIAASGEEPEFFAAYKIRDIARETAGPCLRVVSQARPVRSRFAISERESAARCRRCASIFPGRN